MLMIKHKITDNVDIHALMAFKKLHEDTNPPRKQLDSYESQLASWGKDHLPMMFERQTRSFC